MRPTGYKDCLGHDLIEGDLVRFRGDVMLIAMSTTYDSQDREVEFDWAAIVYFESGAYSVPLCNPYFLRQMRKIGTKDSHPELYEQTQPLRTFALL